MELMIKVGIHEESSNNSSIQSGLRYEIRDRVELLPYNDFNDLV